MRRDQATLREVKRQPEDTFYADDAELQEADMETLREFADYEHEHDEG